MLRLQLTWIEEHYSFEARVLSVVHLDIAQRLHYFVHNANADVVNFNFYDYKQTDVKINCHLKLLE